MRTNEVIENDGQRNHKAHKPGGFGDGGEEFEIRAQAERLNQILYYCTELNIFPVIEKRLKSFTKTDENLGLKLTLEC